MHISLVRSAVVRRLARFILISSFLFGSHSIYAQTFEIDDEGDWGTSHASFSASKATDGDTSWPSRWAATLDNPDGANLWVDLGSAQTVDDIGVIWGRGDQRSYEFEVWARSGTSGSSGCSAGSRPSMSPVSAQWLSRSLPSEGTAGTAHPLSTRSAAGSTRWVKFRSA